jgi:hypothetical protein
VSDYDIPQSRSLVAGDQATPEIGTVTEPVPAIDEHLLELFGSPEGSVDGAGRADDLSELWPARAPSGSLRLRLPMAILAGLALAAGGFWGGAALQKGHQSSSGTSSLASLFAGRRAGAGGATSGAGAGAGGGFAGLSSAAATGTVTAVQGDVLYVTNTSGNLVKVVVGASTTVTRDAKSKLSALQPGDTVIVEGATAKSGVVTASSVAATAAGVSAFGGLGGRG